MGIGVSVYLWVFRPWQLRWGATDDEVRRAMPGDEIVTRPTFNATRASPWRRHLLYGHPLALGTVAHGNAMHTSSLREADAMPAALRLRGAG